MIYKWNLLIRKKGSILNLSFTQVTDVSNLGNVHTLDLEGRDLSAFINVKNLNL